MTDTAQTPAREVVGLFADRQTFEAAVKALLEAGFEAADLSLLASHESLEAAGRPGKPWGDAMTALMGELKFEVPLVASGAIFLFGGAFAATVAGIVGAATAGMALKEVVGEVTSTPHTEDFERALRAGSVILWARAETPEREKKATGILAAHGGANVHVHQPYEEV